MPSKGRKPKGGGWLRKKVRRLAGGTGARVAMLAAAIALLWIGGAAIGTLIGAYPSFNEAVWDSIWHMIDPGALGDDENTKQRVIGVFLAIAGLVILAGAALTLFEELVERALSRVGSADPPVEVADHLLIIGENPALRAIVRRVSEERRGNHTPIVVLVPPTDASSRQALRRELEAESGTEISVVGGDMLDDGLDRVCASEAANIVVLSPEIGKPDVNDLRVMGVGGNLAGLLPDEERPPVALQISRGRNVDVVWDKFPPGIDAVVEDRQSAATIALCLANPAFAGLLSGVEGRGSVFFLDGFEGVRFDQMLERLPGSIPVAVARGDRLAPDLLFAPDPDHLIGPDERVVALGVSGETATPPGSGTANDVSTSFEFEVEGGTVPDLLIVSWSDAAESLVTELIGWTGVVSLTVLDRHRPEGLPERLGNLRPHFITGRPDDLHTLASAVDTVRPGHIVVASTEQSDASAAFAALRLEQIFRARTEEDPGWAWPVMVAQQSSPERARQLRSGLERGHVVSPAELTGQAVAFSATAPEALVVWEELAGEIGCLAVTDTDNPVTFAAVYRRLLTEGIAPIALARAGGALEEELEASSPVSAGDTLLVVRRAEANRN